jgi:hypothetical protein
MCSRYAEHFCIDDQIPTFDDPTMMLAQLEDYLNDSNYQVCVCERLKCSKCDGRDIDCTCMNSDYFLLSIAKCSLHTNCAYIIDLATQSNIQPKIGKTNNAHVFLLPNDPNNDEIPLFEIIAGKSIKMLYTSPAVSFNILDGGTFRKGTVSVRFNYMINE